MLENGTKVTMSELQIGDRVQTGNYNFSHYELLLPKLHF